MTDFTTRLEELDKVATPGPWKRNAVDVTAWTRSPVVQNARTYQDADLIVHLRNHVPEIKAMAEREARYLALVKAARKWIDAYSAVKYTDEEDDAFQATRAALEALDK